MEILSAVLLLAFAIIGVAALLRTITYYLFRYKKDNTIMLIAPMKGKCEDAEFILRSAAAKVKWVSRGKNDYVICLDCDMDDETKRICESICKEYGFAKMLSKKEFLEML